MKKYLLPWYEQYLEPDALNPEYKYPGPPNVAPIDADDYSDDKQPNMTVSVNTAMSMASVFSDNTNLEPEIPAAVGGVPCSWAEVASDVSLASRNTVGTSPQGSNQIGSRFGIRVVTQSSRSEHSLRSSR